MMVQMSKWSCERGLEREISGDEDGWWREKFYTNRQTLLVTLTLPKGGEKSGAKTSGGCGKGQIK